MYHYYHCDQAKLLLLNQFVENSLKNRHEVLYQYRISYVYWLENIIQYWLSEYQQNMISVCNDIEVDVAHKKVWLVQLVDVAPYKPADMHTY